MKLALRGHGQAYILQQSVAAFFPREGAVFAEPAPEDGAWSRSSLEEGAEACRSEAVIFFHGFWGEGAYDQPLSGTDYQREGQRRHAVAAAFYLAFADLLTALPREEAARQGVGPSPWGMLTGVRPDKPAARVMAEGMTPAQARQYLERRYFVPPDRAALAAETAAVSVRLRREAGERAVDVYVAIPFCPTRCAYCSFVSQSAAGTAALTEEYVQGLTEEIRSGGAMLAAAGIKPRALYMGGGTPTTLSPRQLEQVLSALEGALDLSECRERTVEAGRPDTITPEKLSVLRRYGVGRVSVNPQSMDDGILRAIGRRHTAAETRAAMEQVRAYGFPHVNMDLIAGLPGDTPEGFCASLEQCIALGADNITLHTLALKRGSRFAQEKADLPEGRQVRQMLGQGAAMLRRAGFAPYYLYRQKHMAGSMENTGWCRPGAECRYNVDIMGEYCSILSFGAGGATKTVSPGGAVIRRLFNIKDPAAYLRRPEKCRENQAAFAAFFAPGGPAAQKP